MLGDSGTPSGLVGGRQGYPIISVFGIVQKALRVGLDSIHPRLHKKPEVWLSALRVVVLLS
jgi:hypothetical protein